MRSTPIRTARDASRDSAAKHYTRTRRAERRAKSARLFMAFAFGPDASELAPC